MRALGFSCDGGSDCRLALDAVPTDGMLSYVQLAQTASSFGLHAFAPTAKHSRMASPPRARCEGPNATTGTACSGPMPFACGPFLALGRRVVRALLSLDQGEPARRRDGTTAADGYPPVSRSPLRLRGVQAELAAIRALPRGHEKVRWEEHMWFPAATAPLR